MLITAPLLNHALSYDIFIFWLLTFMFFLNEGFLSAPLVLSSRMLN